MRIHGPSWLSALALALLVLGCGPEPKGEGPRSSSPGTNAPSASLRFTHDWVPEPEHGGYYAASIGGIWKGLGLDVEVLVGGPNSEIEKRVALDPFGLGIVRGDAVFIAVARGLPVVAVNSYFQHDPQGILVHATSPVRSFEDLDGREVAGQTGATWQLYLQRKYNLSRMKVRPVTGNVMNFVKDPAWIMQAYPTSEPYYALKEGVESRFLPISASGFDPYRVIIANKRLVERHPDLVARFSRGAYLGWQAYFTNPVPVHEHIGRISPSMEPDGMRYSYVKMRELRLVEGDPGQGESMGAVDLQRWSALGAMLKDLDVIPFVPPLKDVATDAFSPQALGIDPALGPWFWTNAPVQRRKP